eukprot:CAMPEP_0116147334 /NCGR_PEP_ID=MMETSP0329-20121206/17698_1 /TAXON_ID=697910 /ORGANISM="Pseudo-nitzschia arenysensis, Strain B593" /LENGTH=983 /DNA_ID=CAMNT_0003643253 /DNA_START=173 /DNA_END=3120 /DNA_ORIENTATION=-
MRQIITQNHWSGASSGSINSRNLTTVDTSGSRGETDSSFEVSQTSSYQGRSYAKSKSPSRSRSHSGSMQFVPADHHTTQNNNNNSNRYVETAETSWDALANDSEYGSRVATPAPSSALRAKHRMYRNKARQQPSRRSVSPSTTTTTTTSDRSGSKIGRKVASMFSSRAVPVAVPHKASTPDPVPKSPTRSESSTGYVGWPGTQDKQGDTVLAEKSSYEESEASSRIEHEQDKIHRMQAVAPRISYNNQNNNDNDNDDSMSDHSKTSSAYFNPGEIQAIRTGTANQIYGQNNKNRLAAAAVMRRCFSSSSQPVQPLTEEALAMNDRFTAPSRNYTNGAAAGYRGLLDKTKDVPALLDDASSYGTSANSTATGRNSAETEHVTTDYRQQRQTHREQRPVRTIDEGDEPEAMLGAAPRSSMGRLNLALLGGGLTTIQTTTGDFSNRRTASDFDETLTNSDCDENGFVRIPAFHEMLSAGMNQNDRSFTPQSLHFVPKQVHQQQFRPQKAINHFNLGSGHYNNAEPSVDFSQYYIHPDEMQILVKKFRKISDDRCRHFDYEDLEREEDATKAFALSEMRSRIMEKDIERGLERRGGTTAVDDIVTTSYYKAALRVRDAVIVAKAWRDGATPQDIVNTANLTRRDTRSYYIPRYNPALKGRSKYTWEEVTWVDDNELSQFRCHSLGPRHLKGVEMFTIGDCQSILLKLSNERCQELRAELNEATARQIEAEGLMKHEGETYDGMMTEAEMIYLSSMEEVKSISQKLVLAEKSFGLVKNRIEKLVAKYEALLVHFENETESVAPSSVFSYESSCYSEDYSFTAEKQREDETMARRAQRAELRAELAARESMMSRPGTNRRQAQQQVKDLKDRIADLQSETSNAYTARSAVLARAITRSNTNSSNGRSKIDDIKQRFRNRAAAKAPQHAAAAASPARNNSHQQAPAAAVRTMAVPTKKNTPTSSFHRTVGEEMFQHLDFYERSLKAVERP